MTSIVVHSDPQQLTLVSSKAAPATPAFVLKGSMFSLMVLYLKSADVEVIVQQLAERLAHTPNFFKNTPVVLDLQGIADGMPVPDFRRLTMSLRDHGMFAVGVRHASPEQKAAALAEGLGILPPMQNEPDRTIAVDEQHLMAVFNAEDELETPLQPVEKSPATDDRPANPIEKSIQPHGLLVKKSVRGGQQIYHPGDLIVLGAVNAGAEVLADGNIHVYGPLRGRALAGVKGDAHARVFCHSMEAELLSIAGIYRVSEETLPDPLRGKPVQVYLDAERLVIEAL